MSRSIPSRHLVLAAAGLPEQSVKSMRHILVPVVFRPAPGTWRRKPGSTAGLLVAEVKNGLESIVIEETNLQQLRVPHNVYLVSLLKSARVAPVVEVEGVEDTIELLGGSVKISCLLSIFKDHPEASPRKRFLIHFRPMELDRPRDWPLVRATRILCHGVASPMVNSLRDLHVLPTP